MKETNMIYKNLINSLHIIYPPFFLPSNPTRSTSLGRNYNTITFLMTLQVTKDCLPAPLALFLSPIIIP